MKRIKLFGILTLLAVATAMVFLLSENSRLKSEIAELHEPKASPSTSISNSSSRKGRSKNTNEAPLSAPSFESLLAIEDPSDRIAALLDFAENLSADQIPETLKNIRLSSPHWDPEAKMIAHLLLTRWAMDDPEAALASLKGIDLLKFGADPVSVLSGVSATNPDLAIAWLDDPSNPMVKFPFMGQILAGSISKEWVRSDPDAALKWAKSLPDSQKTGALTGVLGTLASTDPAKAATLALDLKPGGSRDHLIGEIASSWAKQSPEEAMVWAATLSGKDRERALKSGLNELARSDTQSAVSFVEGLEPDEQGAYLESVSGPWAGKEPDKAADWVMDRAAESDAKDAAGRALGGILWQWTTQDPEAAGNWLNAQEKGPELDGAITGLAGAAFDEDPEASLSWATQISDDGLRGISLAVGLGTWMSRDAEAAKTWASENNIPIPGSEEE